MLHNKSKGKFFSHARGFGSIWDLNYINFLSSKPSDAFLAQKFVPKSTLVGASPKNPKASGKEMGKRGEGGMGELAPRLGG